jgi:hypothetical protein
MWRGVAWVKLPNLPAASIPAKLVWEDGPKLRLDQDLIWLFPRGWVHLPPFRPVEVLFNSLSRATVSRISFSPVPVRFVEFHLINAKDLPFGVQDVGDYRCVIGQTFIPHDPVVRFTHIGRIERVDGTDFDPTDAAYRTIVEAITWTMTFASARITSPAIERGFDRKNRLVWMNVSSIRSSLADRDDPKNWTSRNSSFTKQSLGEVLKGFYMLLSDPHWCDSVVLAVDFYANAFGPSVVGAASLVLVQSGLEKLESAWSTSPLSAGYVGSGGFGNRLTAMLHWANIGTLFPSQFPELAALGTLESKNAPNTVAYVRNKFTHKKPPHLTRKHETQANNLAIRYLELLLLRLAGAKYPVVNRLVTGPTVNEWTTEPLPWMPWVVT